MLENEKSLCYNFSMNFFDAIKKYDGLKFKDAEYITKSNTLTANFLYNPTLFNLADNAVKVENILKEEFGKYINIDTHFTKCSLDEKAITLYAYTTITNNFPAINKDFNMADIKV